MSISSPSARIVPDAPRTGRPPTDDIETRTPLGRWVHRQEERTYSLARLCLFGRNAQSAWACHDRLADAANADTRICARELLTHDDPVVRAWAIRILGNCGDYERADRAEDACTLGLFRLIADMHAVVREIGGGLERLAVALRGRR